MSTAKILIVDDEPQIRRVLRTTLTSQGYTVVEARSGEEAFELVREDRPDLILLDVNLPGISGLETCREIRSSSDIPIIMLTVRGSERDKVQALDAGADDYVTKPFGSEELMARIRAGLRRAGPAESMPPFVSTELKIDFEKRSATEIYAEVLPPPVKKAIAEKKVIEGMDRDQVLLALGRPDHKSREVKDGMEIEDWVFGQPPGRIVFVTFNGNKVIKVKEEYAGLGTQVDDPKLPR